MRGLHGMAQALLAQRAPAETLRPPSSPGVYAIFARAGTPLALANMHPERLLYVGITESSLELRSHFEHGNSGFSTLRRTLGAILRTELDLTAVPRGLGSSRSNVTNYRFSEGGEGRLSDWMRAFLEWSFVATSDDAAGSETALIAAFRPPLNLKGWPNPRRAEFMELRRRCRDQAAAARILARP